MGKIYRIGHRDHRYVINLDQVAYVVLDDEAGAPDAVYTTSGYIEVTRPQALDIIAALEGLDELPASAGSDHAVTGDEPDEVLHYVATLYDLQRQGKSFPVVLSPTAAFYLLRAVQIAYQHGPYPYRELPSTAVLRMWVEQELVPIFAGTPVESYLARSWDDSDVQKAESE